MVVVAVAVVAVVVVVVVQLYEDDDDDGHEAPFAPSVFFLKLEARSIFNSVVLTPTQLHIKKC